MGRKKTWPPKLTEIEQLRLPLPIPKRIKKK